MQIAIKAIMYGGTDNIPPAELTQKQKQKIKQYKYELRNELQADKTKREEAGDIFGKSHSPSSNSDRVVSVPVTRSNDIKPLVANFVNGVHEDNQCIIH